MTAQPARATHEPAPLAVLARRPSYPWLVVGTVCIGAFMGQLDASIAQLVLPTLETTFRTHRLRLTGGVAGYRWALDGQSYPHADPLAVHRSELVRVELVNHSMMWHPMHLHGHSVQVDTGTGHGPFKDVVLVAPMGQRAFTFVADNPGQWLFHCHNTYHMDAGMAGVISYNG